MKIDFVMPWVDGNDTEWILEKNKYLNTNEKVDVRNNRYRDWGTLKYWFRGVEKFAPWVNNIFFITCGQIPDWLNTQNEKLIMINHKDYIPAKYLPTFSANPIELNLHNITQLSECFVYFNDDTFLTNSCSMDDFFVKGLPCDYAIEDSISFAERDVMNNILVNDMVLINTRFDRRDVLKKHRGKIYSLKDKRGFLKNVFYSFVKRHDFIGVEFAHLPQPFLKSVFEQVWEENYECLDEACRNKFRSENDLNQYIVKIYQYCLGKFTPYNIRRNGYAFQLIDGDDPNNNIKHACEAIYKKKYKMICLNDSKVNSFEETKSSIINALESILNEKSSFEL